MAAEPETTSVSIEQLDDVMASHLRALDAGESPRPEDVIARYPHLAAELRAAFADADYLDPVLEPLRTSAPEVPQAETFPQSFGAYQLLGLIDMGGMGVVYRARQKTPNRIVAIKKIRDGELASPEDVQRFRREADNVAKLDHPNIVPIYEVGEHEDRVFFSMKFVQGGSLAKHLKTFADRPRATARLIAVVARAVHYAHQHLVVHRDLKPANILLEPPGPAADHSVKDTPSASADTAEKMKPLLDADAVAPFVTDFGLACRIDDAASMSSKGGGTPGYMAPEQAAGEKGVNTATDVYGLGAVLYECLTGRPPFHGATLLETLEQVRDKTPVAPRKVNRKVDRDLEVICLACLNKDPAKRYGGSAKELADDLQRYLDHRPIRARPVGRLERAALWARRRPGIAALAAAVVIVAVLGLSGVLWQWADAEAALQREAVQNYINCINLAQRYLDAGQPYRAEEVLVRCPAPLRAWEWYYLEHLCRRDQIVLVGHNSQVLAVQYSPDGTVLATADQDGAVMLWDSATGAPRQTLAAHTGSVEAVCFAVHGDQLLVISSGKDQTVRVWDAASGKLLQEMPGAGNLVAGSRDGHRIASVGQAPVVSIWDLDEESDGSYGRVHRVPLGIVNTSVTGVALSSDGRYLAVCGYWGLLKAWDGTRDWRPLQFDPETAVGLKQLWAVAFSPGQIDGRPLRLATSGEQTLVWEVDDTIHSPHYISEPGEVTCGALRFSPDGTLLAGTFRDGLVRLWNTRTGTIMLTPASAEGHNHGLAFSPDGSRLALTCGYQATVEKNHPGPPIASRELYRGPADVWALAFNKAGQLAFRTGDNVIVADLAPVALHAPAPIAAHVVDSANLTFNGDQIISGCAGGPLWVWDAAASARSDLDIPADDVRCCAVSDDGRLLATTHGDNCIDVWDLPGGGRHGSFSADAGDVKALAFRPQGHGAQLAVCGSGSVVTIWDAATGKKVTESPRVQSHSKAATGLAFSRDGSRLASCGADLTVRVWDPDSGRQIGEPLRGHYGCLTGVAFSQDGRRIASCATDGTVKLWDAESGREVLTLTGHDGPVQAVAFSPDGDVLATCSRDGAVRLWDAPGAGR